MVRVNNDRVSRSAADAAATLLARDRTPEDVSDRARARLDDGDPVAALEVLLEARPREATETREPPTPTPR